MISQGPQDLIFIMNPTCVHSSLLCPGEDGGDRLGGERGHDVVVVDAGVEAEGPVLGLHAGVHGRCRGSTVGDLAVDVIGL